MAQLSPSRGLRNSSRQAVAQIFASRKGPGCRDAFVFDRCRGASAVPLWPANRRSGRHSDEYGSASRSRGVSARRTNRPRSAAPAHTPKPLLDPSRCWRCSDCYRSTRARCLHHLLSPYPHKDRSALQTAPGCLLGGGLVGPTRSDPRPQNGDGELPPPSRRAAERRRWVPPQTRHQISRAALFMACGVRSL